MIVTIEEARLHLRVTGNDEDSLIADFIGAAEAYIEKFLNMPVPGIVMNPQAVPKAIKVAALLIVTNLYENRGNDGTESVYNNAVNALLHPYRVEIGI